MAARLKNANPRLHNTTDLLDRERVIRAIEIAEFHGEDSRRLLSPGIWKRPSSESGGQGRFCAGESPSVFANGSNQGMIEEVKNLHQAGVSFEKLDYYGLEYRYVAMHLQGQINKNDMFQKLNSAIHQFAKRQETWFRRMERQGIRINWVDGDQNPAGTILNMLKNQRSPVDS